MSLADHTVLFGGSFDPPHLGHQFVCLYLLEGLGASSVWVMPSRTHPFGKALHDFEHRFAMCQKMAQVFGGRVVVTDIERRLGGDGRTYDTLVHLHARYPDLRFALAIGADNLAEAEKWYRWREIEHMLPVVAIGRGGYPNSERTMLEMPAVSSSDLRARLARGESVHGLVPQSVAEYISANKLYAGGQPQLS